MQSILQTIVAATILFPYVVFLVSVLLLKFMMVGKRKTMQWASEVTAIFLMFSVYFLIQSIFKLHLSWLIMLIVIFFFALAAFYQYSSKNEIDFLKVGHMALRACFIFFTAVYFLLILIGMMIRIVKMIG